MISEEAWDGIMTLSDDVAIRMTGRRGVRARQFWNAERSYKQLIINRTSIFPRHNFPLYKYCNVVQWMPVLSNSGGALSLTDIRG
ncbi:hypothetical protein LMG28727_01376 [Paraburkholderia kirstenboschensis]|nr:hypothetical protein LMG28727_01376 [Paraburkholderia kirstenboschensis]